MAERRGAKRTKKRLTCELRVGDSRTTGIVIDVSQTGLFVQTSANLAPDTLVDLRITHGGSVPEIGIRARVARQRKVDPRLVQIATMGLGLEILEAPDVYYSELLQEERPRARSSGSPSGRAPRAGAASGRAPRPAPAAAAGPPDGRPFKVRVSQTAGTRSRVLKLEAPDEADARRQALAKVGEGWEVIEVSDG